MKVAVLARTGGGERLAAVIAARLPGAAMVSAGDRVAGTMARLWPEYDAFVCVMAAGIVVRALAPLLDDKRRDPCCVVVDETGRFAVSLLSGHLGGGNDLARQVAAILGGQAVITTASDLRGHTALDLWARDLGLRVEDHARLTWASARLLAAGSLHIWSEIPLPFLPPDLVAVRTPAAADIVVSCSSATPADTLVLRPRLLVAGIGCNRGVTEEQVGRAVAATLAGAGLSPASLAALATIDVKRDEAGLLAYARAAGLPLFLYSAGELNAVQGVEVSEAARRATGARAVAEPAALLAAHADKLLIRKQKCTDLTVAVAMAPSLSWAPGPAATNI